LAEISPNQVPNHELTPYKRGVIYGRFLAGETTADIADIENTPLRTIQSTIQNAEERCEGKSRRQSGRPPSYSYADECRLVNFVRRNPKATWQKTKKELGFAFGESTYKTILSKYHISKWRACRRPYLKQEYAIKRLKFAKDCIKWEQEKWDTVIWSDECSVERGKGKKPMWVFRTPDQKWDSDKIQTYKKGKDLCVMVWAAFSIKGGRSEIFIMERDEAAKKNGYTAQSYLQVLEENLPSLYEPGLIFMQDRAPIHTSNLCKAWFAENLIEVLNHPPYSPDLNPIKHLWRLLKEKIQELYPDLESLTGPAEAKIEALETAIKEAWLAIPQEYSDAVVNSMQRRCKAVIKAKGWQTKY
jgi:transposase